MKAIIPTTVNGFCAAIQRILTEPFAAAAFSIALPVLTSMAEPISGVVQSSDERVRDAYVPTLPLFADYAVTAATSQTASLALYTSAAKAPTYSVTTGAFSAPFLITYMDGETVSATSASC